MSPSPGDAWYPTRASLANRELGLARPRAFLADVASRRRDALSLAGDKTLSMPWASGVNALRVDETEHRYLLAGATDATIAVYDTAQPSRVDPRTGVATHDPILRVRRGAGDGAARSPGHAFAVSSVDWYPVDTGMFFTASFDQTVAGWDANACARVVDFAFEDKVYCIATAKGGRGGGIGGGGGGATHALVACGLAHPVVKLCDPVSGNVTHALSGHRDAVWALEWARGSEYVLVSGGGEGDVRLWDVRRAGAFMVLDRANAGATAAVDALASATTFPEDRRPTLAGPAPPTRRAADSVPEHLWSDDAVRCRGSSFGRGGNGGGGGRAFARDRRGFGGGGGWGMGFRRAANALVDGGGGNGGVAAAGTIPARAATGGAHAGRVTAVACTPDGLHLLTAGTDNRIYLWDLATGLRVERDFGECPNDAKKATTLGVSPDGKRAYHPSSDGDVLVFDVHGGGGGGGGGDDDDDEGGGGGATASRGRGASAARGRGRGRGGRMRGLHGDGSRRRGGGPRPFSFLKGHLAAASSVAVHAHSGEVYTGGADRHVLVWRAHATPMEVEPGSRATGLGFRAIAPGTDRGERGVYRPFRATAEHRRAAGAEEDDWSDDDGGGGGGGERGGVDPDPGARSGIHGLGYRRR